MAIEKAVYRLEMREGRCEIRVYAPLVLALSKETSLRGGSGFRRIFAYINGENQKQQKISMTAPVINHLSRSELTTAFVMPEQLSRQGVPGPLDPELEIRPVDSRRMAAIRFSGRIRQHKLEQKTEALLAWLQKKQLTATGGIELARYQPPFLPGFLHRNELLVEISEDKVE